MKDTTNIKKWPLLIAVMLVAGGCSVRNMNAAMESWRGAHVNEVMKQWGYPTRQITVASHNLYVWDTNNCERTLDADKTGIIRGWEHAGNGCPVFKNDVRRYARPESSAMAALYQPLPGPRKGSWPIERGSRSAADRR